MSSETVKLNVLRAKQAGLVEVYFPNGSAFEGWCSACYQCRHNIDDLENPKPGSLTPPFTCCTWGILDRIYEAMSSQRYGYGMSFHPPEDVRCEKFDPECLRFTPQDYGGDDRDPPKPDVPGQLRFDDMNVPVERTAEPGVRA